MSDSRKTKISFLRAVLLCALVVFCPGKLEEKERADEKERLKFPQPPPGKPHRAVTIRGAFWSSLRLVLSSVLIGVGAGKASLCLLGPTPENTVSTMQIIGAVVLLWGTLFVRGWEIQTFGGVTLSERVNQWIYRGLYCVGTVLIVYSLNVTSG